MLKVAITGGIASGKSLVLNCIKMLGYPVISADNEIAKIYQDQAILDKLSKVFCTPNLTKEAIKPIVLKDKAKLKILETILYKKLYQNFNNFERECRMQKHALCFFEIPLLFEKRSEKKYDTIINLEVPIFIQKERFLKRGNHKESDFYKFKKLQLANSQKRHLLLKHKGYTLQNITSIKHLETEIAKILQKIKNQVKQP